MKKRGGKLLAEASPREDTAPSPREDTAPVQEIGADQEIEVSPLYGTEGAEEQYPPTQNLGGQPRESTLANKNKREDEFDSYYCAITNIYITKKKEYSSRLPNNFMKNTIDAQKESCGISSDTIVIHATIRSCKRRGQNRSKKGPVAPLANIEPALVTICLQMAFFRHPLNAKEGLLLMNSIIDRRPIVQENLILFK